MFSKQKRRRSNEGKLARISYKNVFLLKYITKQQETNILRTRENSKKKNRQFFFIKKETLFEYVGECSYDSKWQYQSLLMQCNKLTLMLICE